VIASKERPSSSPLHLFLLLFLQSLLLQLFLQSRNKIGVSRHLAPLSSNFQKLCPKVWRRLLGPHLPLICHDVEFLGLRRHDQFTSAFAFEACPGRYLPWNGPGACATGPTSELKSAARISATAHKKIAAAVTMYLVGIRRCTSKRRQLL